MSLLLDRGLELKLWPYRPHHEPALYSELLGTTTTAEFPAPGIEI